MQRTDGKETDPAFSIEYEAISVELLRLKQLSVFLGQKQCSEEVSFRQAQHNFGHESRLVSSVTRFV